MKKLIQAQINEGEIIESVSSQKFKEFQTLFAHIKKDTIKCSECGTEKTSNSKIRNYSYRNLQDFLNDREILEGMIK